MEKITNQKFQVIESVNPKLTEVVVTFNYGDQVKRHYIFLQKKKGMSGANYIAEAKKQFELDLKNKKVTSLKRRGSTAVKGSSKLAKGLIIGLSCTTLAFAGLFTWKLLANPNDVFEPREITYEEAQDWLDDHYTVSDWKVVQSGYFSWDYSESVPDPVNPGAFFQAGLPLLVSYLINQNVMETGIIKGTEEKTVSNFYYEGWNGQYGFNPMTGNTLKKYIKSVTKEGDDPKPIKCRIESDGLHVKYKRHQVILPSVLSVDVIEEDVYDTNCYGTKFNVSMDKTPIDFPGGGSVPAFKGEITGEVNGTCYLTKYDEGYNWVKKHYDPTGDTEREVGTVDYEWDFTECEGQTSEGMTAEDYVLGLLGSLLGEDPEDLDLKGERKGMTPSQGQEKVSVLTDQMFKNRYSNLPNALFEMEDDQMAVSYNQKMPESAPMLPGFITNLKSVYDTDCFERQNILSGDHSVSTVVPGIIITGYLNGIYHFVN